jgi:uncharacterized protein YbjQ (UPF0145 family)
LIKEAKSTLAASILPIHQTASLENPVGEPETPPLAEVAVAEKPKERGGVIAKKSPISGAAVGVARGVAEVPRVAPPAPRTQTPEGLVLVTTTQQIEGRNIDTYFGLINSNAVMEIDNELSGPIGDDPPSTAMLYRRHFNNATLVVLRDLRHTAAGLGANAVIAVSFSFQKMEGGLLPTILLSAVGTAVHIA